MSLNECHPLRLNAAMKNQSISTMPMQSCVFRNRRIEYETLLIICAVLVPASLLLACSDHAEEHASADTKDKKVIGKEAKKLGVKASHGCIRLAIPDAKWIYENIPQHTKVVIG